MTTAITSLPNRRTFNRLDRFIPLLDRTSDPLGFGAGDANLSRYVGNHPTMAVDPTGLAEGHHWTPINVIAKLYGERLISEAEYHYFAGRMSGDLVDGHGGYGAAHRAYDCAVEGQLRDWVKAGKKPDQGKVVEFLKEGRSFNGKRVVPVIRDFNGGIANRTIDKTFDAADDDDIINRGRQSLKNRGRLLAVVGALGAISEVGDKVAAGGEIARVLTEGEGMCRAMDAARAGKPHDLRNALIGTGFDPPSVYDELMMVHPPFALVFRRIVDDNLDKNLR